MYEDGTNVPVGTPFLEARRVVSNLYVPAESKAPSDWVAWWSRLRARFEKLRDECRPIECVLVQKHTPDFCGPGEAHPILRCFEGRPRHVGGLSRDDSPLLTPTGQQLFGAFAIRDVEGKPITNGVGDPIAWRFGLRRDFYLYPAPLDVEECRPLPGDQH